jgi:hypothetical protein
VNHNFLYFRLLLFLFFLYFRLLLLLLLLLLHAVFLGINNSKLVKLFVFLRILVRL